VAREWLEVTVRWKDHIVVTSFGIIGDLEDMDDMTALGSQALQMDRRWGKRDNRHYAVDVRRRDSSGPPFTWVPRLYDLPPES
jgi:hypothetical protein